MHDPAGRHTLVYNGEVYNFREIRRDLQARGEEFITDGDTEVVLRACVRWGVDALSHFNGMFALAYYDRHARSGFVARDRFGVKPLLYAAPAGRLCFASELGGLEPLGAWDRQIDRRALTQLLLFGYIAHPRTIHRGVRRLGPGEVLTFDARGAAEPRSWYSLGAARDRVATTPTHDAQDYGESSAAVRRAIARSVDLRKVSDVPIGAFLSGGLDSSIIVAHLSALIGRPIQTFCVGHAEHATYDETRYARLVAGHFSTDHHELKLSRDETLAAVPLVLNHLSEPVGDSSIIPTWLVSRFAAERVTVALSGDAGDELFAGYWRYTAHDAFAAYQRVPRFLRRGLLEPLLRCGGSAKSSRFANKLRQFRKLLRATGGDAFERHLAWSRILPPESAGGLVDPDEAAACVEEVLDTARRLSAPWAGDDELNRLLAFDIQYGLPSDMLQKVDLASMAHSLEVRTPFLDPGLVELAMSLPASFKMNRGRKKIILGDSHRGLLPDAILERPKMGFEVPVGEFLRSDLESMFRDVVTPAALGALGGVDPAAVEGLFEAHRARRGEFADVLFTVLSLCWWQGRQRPA
jgi:asparagine synthase (glutamine-hydrolysing)